MNTPSEQLASNIVNRLVAEGLVSEAQGKRLEPLLATGKATAEDWRLPVELAIPDTKGVEQ